MRGKLLIFSVISVYIRITPAGAGKTTLPMVTLLPPQDHPRRCGENSLLATIQQCRLGSPPQVRGKRSLPDWNTPSVRITPAGAGKTRTCLLQVGKPQDHPRRCGENSRTSAAVGAALGSPPQVRGKRGDRRNSRCCRRITPAGAGKTYT